MDELNLIAKREASRSWTSQWFDRHATIDNSLTRFKKILEGYDFDRETAGRLYTEAYMAIYRLIESNNLSNNQKN